MDDIHFTSNSKRKVSAANDESLEFDGQSMNGLKKNEEKIKAWPSYSPEQSPQQADIPSSVDSSELSSGNDEQPKDHFISKNGVEFAGTHLIIDFWGAKHLNDLKVIEDALRTGTEAANATLLHIHLHHFSEGGGVSGVAVLAESHISVHTWPERDYAAFDIFMCGSAKPEETLAILEQAFSPEKVSVSEYLRGRVDE